MTNMCRHSPFLFRWLELCAWTLAVSGAVAYFASLADVQNTRETVATYVAGLGKTVLRLNKRAPSPPAAISFSSKNQRIAAEAGSVFAAHSQRQAAKRLAPPAKQHKRGKGEERTRVDTAIGNQSGCVRRTT